MTIKPGWQGRFFEDFMVGDVYQHPGGRTLTEVDNTWFTLLTMNTHPLHFDAEYGKQTEFGRCLINSTLTLSIVVGMSVTDVSLNAVANLGWDEVRLPHPLFAGDTLYAESEVLATRESRSRSNAGIVTVRTRGFNQHGDLVIDFRRSALIYRKGAAPDMAAARQRQFPAGEDTSS
ncbi:MAG TPA: MaoC family dehydratase [Thermomicrobiales bacterium]|nr:MaoC family dehydratase [Thermomicrobiales bacterium]